MIQSCFFRSKYFHNTEKWLKISCIPSSQLLNSFSDFIQRKANIFLLPLYHHKVMGVFKKKSSNFR